MSEAGAQPTRRSAMDRDARRACWSWTWKVAASQVALLALLMFDPASRERVQAIVAVQWPSTRGTVAAHLFLLLMAVVGALTNIGLFAWVPMKLVDRWRGSSTDLRWGWCAVLLGIPVAYGLFGTAGRPWLPAGAWWLQFGFQLAGMCVAWFLLRRHGFLTALAFTLFQFLFLQYVYLALARSLGN